jgi:hypothetical protein
MRRSGFKELYQRHPSLFAQVISLEKAHHEKHNLVKSPGEPEKHYFIKDEPMWELHKRFDLELSAEQQQQSLWDDLQDSMNCICKFS